MSLAEFNEITVGQFLTKWEGFFEFEIERQKQEWKRVNYLAYNIMINNPSIPNHRKPSFEEFLNEGSEKNKVHKLTKEEFEKLIDG